MSKATDKADARRDESDRLRERYNVTPGATVYTLTTHVSRSGMSRTVRVFVVVDGELFDISGPVSTVLDRRFDRDRGGVIVGGCGFDAGFDIVYGLSRTLYPDHVGQGQPHAGYSLTHRSL